MAYRFRNLAFEGGGVWGVAYAGVLEALEERGALQAVERAAGTSVGAIAALCIALRYEGRAMKKILRDLDFRALIAERAPFDFTNRYGWYTLDPLEDWLANVLEGAGANFEPKQKFSRDVTFADLDSAGCRGLHVFATDLNRRAVQEFSARETPDASVVKAVAASSAIPGFYQAVRFPDGIPNDHIYVDGGIVLNYPIMAFDSNTGVNSDTLGFKFVRSFESEDPDFDFGQVGEWARRVYDTIANQRTEIIRRAPAYYRRTVFLDAGSISPIDFEVSDWQKKELMERGRKATIDYLDSYDREHSPWRRMARLFLPRVNRRTW